MPAEPTNEPTPKQRDEAAGIVRAAAAGRITLPVEASITRHVARALAAAYAQGEADARSDDSDDGFEPAHGIRRALDGRRAVGSHPLAIEVQEAIATRDAKIAALTTDRDFFRDAADRAARDENLNAGDLAEARITMEAWGALLDVTRADRDAVLAEVTRLTAMITQPGECHSILKLRAEVIAANTRAEAAERALAYASSALRHFVATASEIAHTPEEQERAHAFEVLVDLAFNPAPVAKE